MSRPDWRRRRTGSGGAGVAGAGARMSVLELAGGRSQVRRAARRRRRDARGGGGLAPRGDRPERRRKVDALPPDLGNLAPDVGPRSLRGRGRHALGAAPAHPARHGSHVPALEPLRRPRRQARTSPSPHSAARPRPQPLRADSPLRRRRRTLGGTARARRPRRPRRRRGRVALLRSPPSARGRARPGDRAVAAAPRRADRRHVARRGATVPAADRRPSRGADDHDRRARHGRRLRARDGDLRARRGPPDRVRLSGRDPDVRRRAGGLPRARRPDGGAVHS